MTAMNSNNDQGKKESLIRELVDWAKHIVIAVITAFLLLNYVVLNANIPTESMVSTIMAKDRIFANRLAYFSKNPQRGDIVVFKMPDNESVLYVKRIIGLPGETVVIKDGKVFVNDTLLNEPYLYEPMAKKDFGPYVVPESHYFMMGDNRNNSWDSRFWTNKYVDRKKILGKAFIRYFPSFKLF